MLTFTETIDWALLRQQKEALLTIPEQLINATQYDALQGILSLIDHLQDYAVWSEAVSEEVVFNINTDVE